VEIFKEKGFVTVSMAPLKNICGGFISAPNFYLRQTCWQKSLKASFMSSVM
jgi:hypothetical protein